MRTADIANTLHTDVGCPKLSPVMYRTIGQLHSLGARILATTWPPTRFMARKYHGSLHGQMRRTSSLSVCELSTFLLSLFSFFWK